MVIEFVEHVLLWADLYKSLDELERCLDHRFILLQSELGERVGDHHCGHALELVACSSAHLGYEAF